MAQDVDRTFVLYKSLRAPGMLIKVTPKGVKVNREAMWALMAATGKGVYYFAIETEEVRRAVQIAGKVAETVANAINVAY